MGKKMKKYVFVVNPVSGKGKAKLLIPKIEEECRKRKMDYTILETEEGKKVEDTLKEVKDSVIYAVGGDGLISQILPAVVGTTNKLALLPAGSGNDFYKAIQNLEPGEHMLDMRKNQ